MKLVRISRCAMLAAALLLGGCFRNATSPGPHALSGHVILTGYLVDTASKFAGTRVVGDADGVPVELLLGTQVVARTLTTHGVYRFTGVAPGGYRVQTAVGPLADETRTLTITDHDLAAADTLHLVARGNLLPVPNPMQSGLQLYFFLNDAGPVDIRIEDLAGGPVRHVMSDSTIDAGTSMTVWDGNDDSGRRAAGGMYWLIFHAGTPADSLGLTDDRIALLFRQ